ncbi:tRNA threonylcarbamoyladenosine biosynthesis protein TsaE [Chlamydia avium]|uniref:tRNA threonylcarbamoyladenosine biosynthesis protein TsaE n=1 Tax=Chlamydia avium TaxID=1457141 RepID=A0ABN0MSP1_9CHLA|nr:tRNA (adenosine(37)-N6)-threonylcarbamoyltransferase complex ATPase subunit type 1 TsaE [Chlamydia avium]EPP36309.1 hypothetical protein CP10743SC13_0227 [Chlamydia psittaci 10_743_SC13]EPP38551.1 hypothetical protein CP10881SC42_0316 [Chlamydia avium]VVT43315.1 tRNA threonylcarbamoyladenosine biosynthesis protein TsaE [Chlamydia avium]
MDRYRRVTSSYQETLNIGKALGKCLPAGSVVLLFGDYGVGKTEFVRGIVQGYLGDTSAYDVASPSFALLHVYGSEPRRICHYDFYRLVDNKGIYQELFQDTTEDDVICVEWPDKITLPRFRETIRVYIKALTNVQREVSVYASPFLLILLKE